jgi:SAM-dependent methyltransferase
VSGFLQRVCPVCREPAGEVLHRQRLVVPDQFPHPSVFDVVACERCGMVYANPAPDPAAMDCYYATELEFRSEPFSGDSQSPPPLPWELDRLSGTADLIARLIPDRRARVLDVGCGNATLLAQLRDRGFQEMVGIDPSPASVDAGRRRQLDTRIGTLAKVPPALGLFDLVVLSHVLEHLADPGEALGRCRAMLRPGGVLYVEVPDASRFSDFVQLPFIEFNTEHVNYFSGATLSRLATRIGFECIRLDQKTFSLQPRIDYPGVSGFFRLTSPKEASTRDDDLPEAVRTYVRVCSELVSSMDSKLEIALGGAQEVAVRGLGNLAWTLLAVTRLARLDVAAYVDASPSKRRFTIGSRPVLGPRTLLREGVPVVVLSLQHEESIARDIAAAGGARCVVLLSTLLDRPGRTPSS